MSLSKVASGDRGGNSGTTLPVCSKLLQFQQFHIEAAGSPAGFGGDDRDFFPDLRMFGKTSGGTSVCCNILDFMPVLYAQVPLSFETRHCETMLATLNESLRRSVPSPEAYCEAFITDLRIKGVEDNLNVARITTKLCFLSMVSEAIEGFTVEVPGCPKFTTHLISKSRNLASMFMREYDIVGFCWIELLEDTYTHRSVNGSRYSTCQIEVDVSADKIISHPPVGRWSHIVPFKVLSFDIECLGRQDVFPQPTVDPVIQISSAILRYSEPEPYSRTLLTLNTCAPINGITVRSFIKEVDLLENFAKLMADSDADMIIGYNVLNFDLQYLLERAKALNSNCFSRTLGRIAGRESIWFPTSPDEGISKRQKVNANIPGRLILDVYLVISADPAYWKLRYRLEDVCTEFLGFGKIGIHHSEIPGLQCGDQDTRRQLGVYCLQDSLLPLLLVKKMGLIEKYVDKVRKSRLQFCELLHAGLTLTEAINTSNKHQLSAEMNTALNSGFVNEEKTPGVNRIAGNKTLENRSATMKMRKVANVYRKKEVPKKLGLTARRLFEHDPVPNGIKFSVDRNLANVGFRPPRQTPSAAVDQRLHPPKKTLGMRRRN